MALDENVLGLHLLLASFIFLQHGRRSGFRSSSVRMVPTLFSGSLRFTDTSMYSISSVQSVLRRSKCLLCLDLIYISRSNKQTTVLCVTQFVRLKDSLLTSSELYIAFMSHFSRSRCTSHNSQINVIYIFLQHELITIP